MEETGYITTRQAAEKLGITIGRVQQLITEDRLPSVKVGRDRFILEKNLQLVLNRKNGRPRTKRESNF